MQMEDKLEKMLERLGTLEHEYHSDKKVIKVGATVFAVLLVAFFGISLSQIQSKVNAAMKGTAVDKAKKKAETFASKAETFASKAETFASNAKIYETEANNKLSEIKNDANNIRSYKVVVGTIVPYGGEIKEEKGEPKEVGEGWLLCNGASIKCDEYEKLYKVIGTAFGVADSKTFNLPDLRGRFVRGVDSGTGRDPDAPSRTSSNKGGNTGDNVGSVQEDEFKKHIHSYISPIQWSRNTISEET